MKGNYCLVTAPKKGGNICSGHWWVLSAPLSTPCLMVKTSQVSFREHMATCSLGNSQAL